MIGAKPRGPGMERADLLEQNGQIFVQQVRGRAPGCVWQGGLGTRPGRGGWLGVQSGWWRPVRADRRAARCANGERAPQAVATARPVCAPSAFRPPLPAGCCAGRRPERGGPRGLQGAGGGQPLQHQRHDCHGERAAPQAQELPRTHPPGREPVGGQPRGAQQTRPPTPCWLLGPSLSRQPSPRLRALRLAPDPLSPPPPPPPTHRAKCQLALKSGKFYTSVARTAIWGNHSTTQVGAGSKAGRQAGASRAGAGERPPGRLACVSSSPAPWQPGRHGGGRAG
jgi:hypothetical protein